MTKFTSRLVGRDVESPIRDLVEQRSHCAANACSWKIRRRVPRRRLVNLSLPLEQQRRHTNPLAFCSVSPPERERRFGFEDMVSRTPGGRAKSSS